MNRTTIAAAALFAAALPAFGQDSEPRTASPFWNADDGRAESGDTGFPDDLVARVAPARAELAAVRAAERAAQEALDARREQLDTAFETSTQYRQATAEVRDARAALNQARQDVIDRLEADPTYSALRGLADKLSRDAEVEHRQRRPNRDKLLAISQQALSYGEEAADLKTAALAGSPEWTAAEARLEEAAARVDALEAEQAARLREDGEMQQLRAKAREAEANLAAAVAYAESAAYAADVAVGFAYDRVRAENPYNYGRRGYGYGYGGYGGYGYSPLSPFGYGGFYAPGVIVTRGGPVVGGGGAVDPRNNPSPISNVQQGGVSNVR